MAKEIDLEIQSSDAASQNSSTLTKTDHETAPSNPPSSKRSRHFMCYFRALIIFQAVFFIVVFPFYLLYSLAGWLFCGFDVTKQHSSGSKNDPADVSNTPFYQKVLELQEAAKRLADLLKNVRSRLFVFVLIWLILNLSIPGLRNKVVLGSELWKWTLLVTMVSCGYHVTGLCTRFALRVLSTCGWFKESKNVWYYAEGLRVSINLVVLTLGFLLTWVSYFRTTRGMKTTRPDKDGVIHVGTWSFATLAIGAVMWMAKNAVLLAWEADAVYKRFGERILSAGFQLYFLGHICGWEKNNLEIFRPRRKMQQVHQDKTQNQLGGEVAASFKGENGDKNKERDEEKKKARINRRIERAKYYEGVSIYDIKQMTEYLVDLSKVSSREDDGTSDVLVKCKMINPSCYPKDITSMDLNKFDLTEDDAKLLCLDLNREHLVEDSEKILYENFEKSMVRAHKSCVALGHTLLDAIEVVKVLNKVITLVLIALAIVAWLLLTDIATNKILVLIASPFLAATFVFGDTCKKTFEGVIFSFINHPFDVGDLCIIDGIELEVKRMGILTTTFILIATKEEALYPNAALATNSIINLKGEPDPNDCVELKLDSSSKTNLVALKDKITQFFKNDGGRRFEEATTMIIEEIGSCIRLTIHYQNVMSIHEVTHSQCLEKKRKQKSEFLFELTQYMNETRFNEAAN